MKFGTRDQDCRSSPTTDDAADDDEVADMNTERPGAPGWASAGTGCGKGPDVARNDLGGGCGACCICWKDCLRSPRGLSGPSECVDANGDIGGEVGPPYPPYPPFVEPANVGVVGEADSLSRNSTHILENDCGCGCGCK